jgi:hypothetical protein
MLLTPKGRPEVVVLDAGTYQKLIDELRHYQARDGSRDGRIELSGVAGDPAGGALAVQ